MNGSLWPLLLLCGCGGFGGGCGDGCCDNAGYGGGMSSMLPLLLLLCGCGGLGGCSCGRGADCCCK